MMQSGLADGFVGIFSRLNSRVVSFRATHQPYMVRHNYVHEMRSAFAYPLAASLAEGSFTGVIAAKYFQASPVLIAVITAAPMFGNIMAMVWAELASRRAKVPFVNLLQVGVLLSVASVALVYPLPLDVGAWVFAGLIIVARLLASGIVTVRSAIWRVNYPRHVRGQIVARITTVATLVLAGTTFAGSYWLDHDPTAFVFLYPIASAIGVVGIWQFSRIKVRRERSTLRRESHSNPPDQARDFNPRPENMAESGEVNVLNFQPRRRLHLFKFLSDARQVLRDDARFRLYQRYQFLSGFSFMMVNPPLVVMVSNRLTDANSQYLLAIVVLQIIPLLVGVVCTQLWAPMFDRMHITRFRSIQMSVGVFAHGLLLTGAVLGSLPVVALAQVLFGVTNAAGNLAWNLGHNDFSTPDNSAIYMGVHVMLTGLRGCFAPFVGAALYATGAVGNGVYAVALVTCIASLLGFISMARVAPKKQERGGQHRPTN